VSHNPFDVVKPATSQSAQSNIDQAFNNMTISQPMSTQSTGAIPSQQSQHNAMYQQSFTPPPMPQMQQQPYGFNPYMQEQPQQIQPQAIGYNPYLQQAQQQQQFVSSSQSNPFMNQQIQPQATGNPYMQTPQIQPQTTSNPFFQASQPQTLTPNPFLQQQNSAGAYSTNVQYQQQQPQYTSDQNASQQYQVQAAYQQQQQQQQQAQFQAQQQQQQQQAQAQQQAFGSSNPFMQQQHQQQQFAPQDPQQQFQQNQYMQQQPLMAQPTGRRDNKSILALYGMQPSIPEHPDQQPPVPQRSVTMPASMNAGSNNPFGAVPTNAAQGQARVRDSIFAGADDPFASLSAKIR